MPKYKKCPRCELNYILEDEEYCEICREELRGISHNDELEDVEESGVCPICHVNFLNEGETICEACAEMENNGKASAIGDVEPDWDIGDEEVVDETDLADDDVDLSVEDLAEEEAMDDEDDGYGDGEDEDDYVDVDEDIDLDEEDE